MSATMLSMSRANKVDLVPLGRALGEEVHESMDKNLLVDQISRAVVSLAKSGDGKEEAEKKKGDSGGGGGYDGPGDGSGDSSDDDEDEYGDDEDPQGGSENSMQIHIKLTNGVKTPPSKWTRMTQS